MQIVSTPIKFSCQDAIQLNIFQFCGRKWKVVNWSFFRVKTSSLGRLIFLREYYKLTGLHIYSSPKVTKGCSLHNIFAFRGAQCGTEFGIGIKLYQEGKSSNWHFVNRDPRSLIFFSALLTSFCIVWISFLRITSVSSSNVFSNVFSSVLLFDTYHQLRSEISKRRENCATSPIFNLTYRDGKCKINFLWNPLVLFIQHFIMTKSITLREKWRFTTWKTCNFIVSLGMNFSTLTPLKQLSLTRKGWVNVMTLFFLFG